MYGHADIRFMDGNREKWLAENRPLTGQVLLVQPTDYHANEPDEGSRALRERVLDSIGRPGCSLVDVRTPEEYHGELWEQWKFTAEASQRGGHIPGAINIPWNLTVKPDGTLKPFEELQELYTVNGVTPDKEVIPYCIVGGRSNHTWFVLKYLLGYPNVRLYDGSWAEWGTLIGVPVER
jgi:thiosulfate/3-mercaptopyruvate sulfurtransferase